MKQLKLKSLLLHVVVAIAACMTIAPFVWMVSASLTPAGESSVFPPRLLPSETTFEHYHHLFVRLNVGRYFLNSLILAVSVTMISLLVNSMAGFAFAKFAFRGKRHIFAVLVASMIVPGQVTMLPVFLLLNKMGVLNSYLGVILPAMASVFGIFLVRQYLVSVPDSMIEAARIDGAGDFLIYRTIILPLALPVLLTLGLFTFMGTWNDFLWPLIVMTREEMHTLPVALAGLLGEHAQDAELMMAGSVVTIVPVLIVFLALQKYYLQGITVGALKE